MNGGGANLPAHVQGNYANYGQQAPHQQSYQQPITESYDPVMGSTFCSQEDVRQMASILERFHQVADGTAEMLVEESRTNPEVRRAIMTEEVDNGVRVGAWEIRVRLSESQSAKQIKYYSVVQAGSNTVLAEDLMLFEAADLLVRHFNKGKTITSQEVREVLRLEDKFATQWADAANFRRHALKHRQKGDGHAANVFEARYDRAKDEAVAARNALKKLHARG
jgi:hypothetical protein